jgi:hypothetical protein
MPNLEGDDARELAVRHAEVYKRVVDDVVKDVPARGGAAAKRQSRAA